jgi:hypothetical protein
MRMELKILREENFLEHSEWLRLWKCVAECDPFAHPTYLSLFKKETTLARCAVLKTGSVGIMFPFLVRQIPFGVMMDIVTPYGYGGAYCSQHLTDLSIMDEFWRLFTVWEEANGIVSETVRCHLLENAGYSAGVKVQVSENIVCDLTVTPDQEWMGFEHKVRKNVSKARRANVTIEIDRDGSRLDEFLRIYKSTLDRRDGGEEYYFPRSFFEQIIHGMPNSYIFAFSLLNRKVVSSELVLLSKRAIYSFLGGTEAESFDVRPNDLLKYEVMQWARNNGIKQYVLGGGYTLNDGIYRYKKAFSPNGVMPFSIGQRVINQSVYDDLVKQRIEMIRDGRAPEMRERFFPLYRA